jgi:hypothetical protein
MHVKAIMIEGRKEGRMYYCGGPNQEQAGTVPTYNAETDERCTGGGMTKVVEVEVTSTPTKHTSTATDVG